MLRSQVLTLLTNGGGAATVPAEVSLPGRKIHAVEFVLGTLTSGAATVTLTDVGDAAVGGVTKTLLTLTNPAANAVYYPRTVVHDAAGAALTVTTGSDRHPQFVITGKLTATVSGGGATKTGYFIVWYEEVK